MGNKLNILNSEHTKPDRELSMWRIGKRDIKLFYEVKLKKSSNILSFIFGIILTIIVILPFALMLIQFYKAYLYNLEIRTFLIVVGWVLIWLCNGLSNYFTVVLAKKYYPESPKLMNIDEKAILFYETFNPGFIFFSFILLFFVYLGLIGV